jgi:hypothetical protein
VRRPLGDLRGTLDDLAAIGDKRAGSPGGHRAAAYLRDRFQAHGFAPSVDTFHFPRHTVTASTLEVLLDGERRLLGAEVLEACGAGSTRAPLVHLGTAEAAPSTRLNGAIALVERDTLLHRSRQYQTVAEAGGACMLMASTAPGNLHQVGSVRRAWEAAGPIPALALGARDARTLREALAAGQAVEAAVEVAIQIERGTGQNVLARIDGERREQIVIGAHYDTWFAGSTDNGGGVALLLELAARWRTRPKPTYTLVFVAWDGEELALYGGYDFLRRHVVAARAPVLAVIDLETPSSHGAQAYGLARSSHAAWERPLASTGTGELFALDAPMAMVPDLFGGVIPTDIQGLYRAGTAVLSTAGDGPYYHTVEDTPDKVDLDRLAQLADAFDGLIARLMAEPPDRFAGRDSGLFCADVSTSMSPDGMAVQVTVRDGGNLLVPGARVEGVLFHDHFFETASRQAHTDGDGRVVLRFPAPHGPPPHVLQVTAGRSHPLVEVVLPLD